MKNIVGYVSALILAAIIALPAMQQINHSSLTPNVRSGHRLVADGIGQKPYPPRITSGESLVADGIGQKPYPPRVAAGESLVADGIGQKPYPPRIDLIA